MLRLNAIILGVSVTFLMACQPLERAQKIEDMPSRAIRVIGSSTVFPFSTKVAQEYKNVTGQNIIIEATGSGGGHKLFCEGVGVGTPDVINSSRRQKETELARCKANGVADIIEVKIGYDGIVIANALNAPQFDFRARDIYLAFAKTVPQSDTDCTLINNPYQNWSEINPSLPDFKIEAYGPPPTSGTRDAFVEIAMEGGAADIPCLAALKNENQAQFRRVSQTLREDGLWIDAGENDNTLVQTLLNTPTAIGVLGYSFLDQNQDKIKAAKIDSVTPDFEKIASRQYPVSRSLFFYFKKANVETTPGLQGFALEFLADHASGANGYLREIGLVPIQDSEREKYRRDIQNLTPYHP